MLLICAQSAKLDWQDLRFSQGQSHNVKVTTSNSLFLHCCKFNFHFHFFTYLDLPSFQTKFQLHLLPFELADHCKDLTMHCINYILFLAFIFL